MTTTKVPRGPSNGIATQFFRHLLYLFCNSRDPHVSDLFMQAYSNDTVCHATRLKNWHRYDGNSSKEIALVYAITTQLCLFDLFPPLIE